MQLGVSAALDRPLIKRIDSLVAKLHDKAVEAYPHEPLQQDRWLRNKLIEDCAPSEAPVVAMQCDHYLLCLRLNSQAPITPY